MMKFSPLILLPPVIFLSLGALFMIGLTRENPNELPSTFVGREAPPVIVQPLGDLEFLQPDVVKLPEVKLINYWASWCAPCRVEHPNLQTMQDMGIPIYGVNYKDEPKNGLAFLQELGNPYVAVGADPEGRLAIEYGVYGLPETFVVDKEGVIVLRFVGPITKRTLESTILPAIREAQAK